MLSPFLCMWVYIYIFYLDFNYMKKYLLKILNIFKAKIIQINKGWEETN